MITDRISSVIQRWLFETKIEKGPLRKIELRHVNAETQMSEEVESWPQPQDPSAVDIGTLVAQILELAQQDSDGLQLGVQRYFIYGYFGESAEPGGRSQVFPAHPMEELSRDGTGAPGLMPSEPSTERGKDAFAMRHIDTAYTTMGRALSEMMQHFSRELSESKKMNAALLEKHIDVVMMGADLADRKQERDLRTAAEMQKHRTAERLADMILPLVPTMVNKFAGAQILPVTAVPIVEQVKALVGSLSEDQLKKIGAVLTEPGPAQGIAFMDLYETMQKMNQAQEEAKKAPQPQAPLSLVKK